MNKVVLMVLIMVVLLLPSTALSADINSVDFGFVTASTIIEKNSIREIPGGLGIAFYEAWVSFPLDQSARKELPSGRVDLGIFGNRTTLDLQPVRFEARSTSEMTVPLTVILCVMPNDPPGEYTATVHIRERLTDDSVGTQWDIPVNVSVEPWVALASQTNTVVVSREYHSAVTGEKAIYSAVPAFVQIAGNVPWELMVWTDESMSEQLEAVLRPISGAFDTLYPRGMLLTASPEPVATGQMSTEDIMIELSLGIKDYISLPAGNLNLTVFMEARPLR